MAWTTPTDRATGYLVTAVDWNIVEDNLSYLHGDTGNIDIGKGVGAGFTTWQPTNGLVIQNFLTTSDTQPAFKISAQGQILLGPGGSTTSDTTLSRNAAGILQLASSTAGKGNMQFGYVSGSVGAGTVTPDAANFVTRWNLTTTGTYTFATPLNTPPANMTALMCFILHNSSGGTCTLAFSSGYGNTNLPVAPANGQASIFWAVYSQATSHWVFANGSTGFVD